MIVNTMKSERLYTWQGGPIIHTQVKEPVVCGITSLGMDHTKILGDTIEKIAAEKAGIFKPLVPAFAVPQLSEAMLVLQGRAFELMILLFNCMEVRDPQLLLPQLINTCASSDVLHTTSKFENSEEVPSDKFIGGDASLKCSPAVLNSGGSAVIPWLPLTIKLLRDCAKDNPSLRFQVLVTGS